MRLMDKTDSPHRGFDLSCRFLNNLAAKNSTFWEVVLRLALIENSSAVKSSRNLNYKGQIQNRSVKEDVLEFEKTFERVKFGACELRKKSFSVSFFVHGKGI